MIAKRRVEKKAKDGEPDIACAELETEKNWLRERLRPSPSLSFSQDTLTP